MGDINVREVLGTVGSHSSPSEFKWAKWNSTTAFNRLTVLRETRKSLVNGINANVEDLPVETRKKYDKVVRLLKEIESDEIRTITYGE